MTTLSNTFRLLLIDELAHRLFICFCSTIALVVGPGHFGVWNKVDRFIHSIEQVNLGLSTLREQGPDFFSLPFSCLGVYVVHFLGLFVHLSEAYVTVSTVLRI